MLSSDEHSSNQFSSNTQSLQEKRPSFGLLSNEMSPTRPMKTADPLVDSETAVLPVQYPSTQTGFNQYSPVQSQSLAPMQQAPTDLPQPMQYSPVGPAVSGQLSFYPGQGGVTRVLSENIEEKSQRPGVRIKGEMKRPLPPPELHPVVHKKRRLYVSITGMVILVLITSLTLIMSTPMGRDLGIGFNPMKTGNSLVNNVANSVNLVAQATATAISNQQNDGYDPNASNGQQVYTTGAGSLNWPYGQCTYWANYRYHQLTGYWVSWSGNANQWVAGATAAGWVVSQTPHVPSIIVMMAYVQGASGYGHVAVVESIVNPDTGAAPTTTPPTATPTNPPSSGTPTPSGNASHFRLTNSSSTIVHTSNMNWYANGGGWGIVSYADFTVGDGIYFVWHP